MASAAIISLVGNLGGDAEQRFTPSGAGNVQFSLAVNRKKGEEEILNWYRVTLWGKTGENLLQYLTKGKQVFVTGPLTAREYTRADGSFGFSLDVNANDITLLSSNGEQGSSASTTKAKAPTKKSTKKEEEDGFDFNTVDDDDDVPF